MTLDEIEKLAKHAADAEERDLRDIAECRRMEAINTLTGAARGATETAAHLARAVLAMLPVVRLAEEVRRSSFSVRVRITSEHRALFSEFNDAVDAIRAALESA